MPPLDTATACCSDRRGLTALRQRVLDMVVLAETPIKAYDLLRLLQAEQGNASPPTVYRALDFLLRTGHIHRLPSLNAYVSCRSMGAAHTAAFLICNRCCRAHELADPQVTRALTDLADAQGFSPDLHIVELHGICRHCRSDQKSGGVSSQAPLIGSPPHGGG